MEKDEDGKATELLTETTFTVPLEFNEGMLHDHLVSAIEGGSNYWAEIDAGEHQPGWTNYFTATFTVIEMSDEKAGVLHGQKYQLNKDKLKAGLSVLAKKYSHHFCDILREFGDATTGDVLVQCALFGDIIYG